MDAENREIGSYKIKVECGICVVVYKTLHHHTYSFNRVPHGPRYSETVSPVCWVLGEQIFCGKMTRHQTSHPRRL